MGAGLSELAGMFLAVIGVFALVGAAAMVAPALGVAVFGVFALFGGVVVIYTANAKAAAALAAAGSNPALRTAA